MAIIVAKKIHKEYDVGPEYWNPYGSPVFDNSHYQWLTDTGFDYGVIQTGKIFVAQMYEIEPKVTQRTFGRRYEHKPGTMNFSLAEPLGRCIFLARERDMLVPD